MCNKGFLVGQSVTEKEHITFAEKETHTYACTGHPHAHLHAQSWTIVLAGQKVLEE